MRLSQTIIALSIMATPFASAEVFELRIKHDINLSTPQQVASAEMTQAVEATGAKIKHHSFTPTGFYTSATIDADSADEAVKMLEQGGFLWVEPMLHVIPDTPPVKSNKQSQLLPNPALFSASNSTLSEPNDPVYAEWQYMYMEALKTFEAPWGPDILTMGNNFVGLWENTTDSAQKVRVGVPDINFYNHADINYSSDGANFYSYSNDPFTDFGQECSEHGTLVASTIGAKQNSGFGVSGAAGNNIEVVPVETGGCGWISPTNYLDAIYWLSGVSYKHLGIEDISEPVQVINMSMVGLAIDGQCNRFDLEMLDFLNQQGIHLIQGAGNDNQDVYNSSPAVCGRGRMITAGATSDEHDKAAFSNYGNVDISAFGVGVWGYGKVDGVATAGAGTSLSAPLVTSAIAGVISEVGNLDYELMHFLLHSTATNFAPESTCATDLHCGGGGLDAGRMLQAAKAHLAGELSTIRHPLVGETDKTQSVLIKHLSSEVEVCDLYELNFNSEAIELDKVTYELYETTKGGDLASSSALVMTSSNPQLIHAFSAEDIENNDYGFKFCDAVDCTSIMPITVDAERPTQCI
ncbi:S8 family serine peptidase [Shewanella sp. Scap07]|uniref:S8 family peptidase n=1 Tax=Shewanella sp. Scap07 TaxID=2589987 RepID=UPI0015BA29EE|nr:S8 family serine peptidase [Shewanella sp. Scap07]QLE85460.1 S8 family serine peptidase [Shewanella sp. Scap07]